MANIKYQFLQAINFSFKEIRAKEIEALKCKDFNLDTMQLFISGAGAKGGRNRVLPIKQEHIPLGQGFKDMSPPTKELMKLTLEQRLAHGGHPVLRWMMDNIYIRNDPAGNIKADKEKSTEKIDGAIATIMGLDRAIRCGNDVTESVYDERGILFI